MHYLRAAGIGFVAISAGAFTSALLAATAENPSDASGTWALYAMERGEMVDATRLQLSVSNGIVTGKGAGFVITGKQEGPDLHLTATREDKTVVGKVEIHIDGADGKGTLDRNGHTGQLSLHRIPAKGEPKTIDFVPEIFHRTFGGVEPLLKINAGDTVRTTTVDAGGMDSKDITRSLGGNPQTGPIYVDGAIPGDTLAVTIKKLKVNKSIARSGNTIMSVALTPDYFRNVKLDPQVDGTWKLDLEAGIGVLAHPSDRLKDYKVKLKPMIGCMGVSPARGEVFRTGNLGYYGGNLDYSGLHEGTTVYLPVSREGALLQVGDVHALEGDGELTGDALETSADLELLIDVIPGPAIRGPLAEDSEYLMSMGVSSSMEAAMRTATTQLTQWLERDYGLTHSEAALVLGTSMKYEIAEVVDPQFNIVAKVSKSALAPLKPTAKH